ncbi:hypothetical protein COCON_G00119810 [Conger conger]|uniref:Nucleoside diphosphate-linked moiety X motif 6 n=1 Tax=Conger conger TaxID=82655 RepID=A0A9Q1DGR8_CONCO|nr:nucleoside diphosphate-linked moiety X motif 6 isoform X1 [Conger conger]KAJ8269374.1 hypothetical protein COCON_G00119810 [Conger conger]
MAVQNCRMPLILRKVITKQSGGCVRAVWITKMTDRYLSCLGTNYQIHREKGNVTGKNVMTGNVDKFGGITVHLNERDFPPDISESAFSIQLRDSLSHWRAEGRIAVWLHVPLIQSRFITAAAKHGFTFHHARHDWSTLCLWLAEGESRLPGFATHQIGVAGAVLDEASGKVLVVQDKNKTKNAWKFPGGLSEPGENIGDTAVREVLEETGVRAQFKSLLSIRQQHNHPGAFGMSDMYLICRLQPLTFHIDFCTQECLRCDWLPLEELAHTNATTPITSRIARLLLYGLQHGFHRIDLPVEQLPAVYSGMFYQLYHRVLPVNAA